MGGTGYCVDIDTTSPDQDINRKGVYYCCTADGSRSISAATTHSSDKLKIVVIRNILEVYHKIENKYTEKRSPVWVQIPVSNPVLINSTIKFVCLNDRQDVEIRMLCGYWVVWEQDQVALSDSMAIFFVFVYLVSVYLVCIKIKANIEYWIRITQRTDIGQALSI